MEETNNQENVDVKNNVETNQDTTNAGKNKGVETQKQKKDSWSRDEVNKMIATEKTKAIEEYKKQIEAEKSEAERLSKMSEDERHKEELKKATDRMNEAVSKLNAYELKEQVVKNNKDVPLEIIGLIDFKEYNTAELVNAKIKELKEVYKKAVELGINDKMKEKTPKTVVGDTTTKKQVSRYSI